MFGCLQFSSSSAQVAVSRTSFSLFQVKKGFVEENDSGFCVFFVGFL